MARAVPFTCAFHGCRLLCRFNANMSCTKKTNMKSFVSVCALVGCALAAPAADPYLTSGLPAGPLTAAFGDLVSTNRGLRPLSLEGFSEDVNQDGFVDPVGQAVAPVVTYAHAAPLVHHAVAAPVVAAAPVVKAVVAEPAKVEVAAAALPAVTYAAHATPLVHHTYAAAPAVYTVPHVYQTVHHVPQVHVQKAVSTHTTHHVINHAPVIGAYAGLPAVAVAAAAPAVEAEADAAVEAA